MQIGDKLATEAFDPKEIIRQAVEAERAGYDVVEMSDHVHPWLESQGHSGFTWAMLAAATLHIIGEPAFRGVEQPHDRLREASVVDAVLEKTRWAVGGDRLEGRG